MASERSPVVDYAIIVLLLLNLGITTYSTLKAKPGNVERTAKSGSKLDISDSQATALAAHLIKFYNAKDNIGLYQQFDKLAQAQISQEQLTAQLNQLYPVMGTISDAAFSNAVLAGNEGGRDYYTLNYKIRLSGGGRYALDRYAQGKRIRPYGLLHKWYKPGCAAVMSNNSFKPKPLRGSA